MTRTEPSTDIDEGLVTKVAEALANRIAMRNGSPPIRNCLALMPSAMADTFRDEATAALEASGHTALLREIEELREGYREIIGFSDSEMLDGDAARRVARAALSRPDSVIASTPVSGKNKP
jgi:hypothetical protein